MSASHERGRASTHDEGVLEANLGDGMGSGWVWCD